jgi:hypothetical protein
MTDARGRHRAPSHTYRPEHTYRDGAILLGLVSGILMHAIHDAWALEENGWMTFFSLMLAADVGLYLNTVWLWLLSTGRAIDM